MKIFQHPQEERNASLKTKINDRFRMTLLKII